MQKTEIIEKLLRVQATIEHVLVAGKAESIELAYLQQAKELQTRAIKEFIMLVKGKEQA